MPATAANANAQTAALQKSIAAKKADGKVTAAEANALLAQAKQEYVQGGELNLLRALAGDKALDPTAKDAFVKAVDEIVPAGAPTAQIAAILFRLNKDTGRKQLLALLDSAKNPVAGGPKTFVIRGLGAPYVAAITTAQVMMGLTKYLDGASPAQAKKIRFYLGEQLKTFATPIKKGGLGVPGILPSTKGAAFTVDSRIGNSIAVNQSAVVLHALEKVMALKGPENAAVVKAAQSLSTKVAAELQKDLDFAYPATGRLAYSLAIVNGHPVTGFLEDGHHLQTTWDALKSLRAFGPQFAPYVKRIETRIPEVTYAGTEDFSGNHGQIFTPEFNSFRDAAHKILAKAKVTSADVAKLQSLAKHDALLTSGEKHLIAQAQARVGK